jgi:hypothetical protein
MSARVERPVTREKNSVSSRCVTWPGRTPAQTVAGRTPGPQNRRGRVVEAGRPTTVKGAIFAEFHRAVEAGEPHASRLVDPVTPKAPALVALESPPAPGTTPRRPLTPDSVGGAA